MITPHDIRVMPREEKLRLLQLLHDDLMSPDTTSALESPRRRTANPRQRHTPAISWEEPGRMFDEELSAVALNS